MNDFHAHILPNMDDGAKTLEESIYMLRESANQEINNIVATPHFYAFKEYPKQFLKRREFSFKALSEKMVVETGLPNIILGAEVSYFDGISNSNEIIDLKIQGTNLLLIEMPYKQWDFRNIHEIINIIDKYNIIPILAHIERYLDLQKEPDILDNLLNSDVLIQANANFFINWKTSRLALKMLKNGKINLLGSDCHDLKYRPPNLKKAVQMIQNKNCESYFLDMQTNKGFFLDKNLKK